MDLPRMSREPLISHAEELQVRCERLARRLESLEILNRQLLREKEQVRLSFIKLHEHNVVFYLGVKYLVDAFNFLNHKVGLAPK